LHVNTSLEPNNSFSGPLRRVALLSCGTRQRPLNSRVRHSMAQIEFFAAPKDVKALIDRILLVTDDRFFQTWSAFDEKPREFHTSTELSSFVPLGKDSRGDGFVEMFTLWSPTALSRRSLQRVALNPALCDVHQFRYSFLDSATPYLHLGGAHGRAI